MSVLSISQRDRHHCRKPNAPRGPGSGLRLPNTCSHRVCRRDRLWTSCAIRRSGSRSTRHLSRHRYLPNTLDTHLVGWARPPSRALAERRRASLAGEKLSDTELQRRVVTLAKTRPERAWLAEVASVALVQACQDARR